MTPNNCLPVIGITGNTGGGKTAVSEILARLGGYVINADTLSHQVIMPGQPAYDEIIAAFGPGIRAGGQIDRRKLGAVVFNDPGRLKLLESIIHPRVAEETFRQVASVMSRMEYPFIVLDAPLLIEAGMHHRCDSVWVVTAEADIKEKRILARDGLTLEAAQQRIRSQRSEAWLTARADYIIENNQGLIELRDAAAAALQAVLIKWPDNIKASGAAVC